MLRKKTFYGLGLAVFLVLVCLACWEDLKFPNDSLRADVAPEVESKPEGVAFFSDYEEGIKKASREDKPALLFFMAKNCEFSREMMEDAFVDPQVERLSREFVCIQIDMNDPQNDEICDSFDVSASPTVLFATSEGSPLQRLASVQSGERLVEQMKAALTSVAWRAAHLESRESGVSLFR